MSLTSQFHRRIRHGDSRASRPSGRRWPLALPGRGVKVPGRHGSQRDPSGSPPSWTWSRSWRHRAPGRAARPRRSPGARSSQAARPLSRASLTSAGSRLSAPVMLTCPAPGLLKQAVQSPSRAQLVNHIPTTSRSPVVIISSSHQCQSFHKSSHKPMNRLRDRSLDAAAALIELTGSQGHDMEGVHHRPRRGQLFAGGTLEPGETIHRHHLDLLTSGLVALGEPGLEDLLDTGPGPRPADEPDHCGGVRGS